MKNQRKILLCVLFGCNRLCSSNTKAFQVFSLGKTAKVTFCFVHCFFFHCGEVGHQPNFLNALKRRRKKVYKSVIILERGWWSPILNNFFTEEENLIQMHLAWRILSLTANLIPCVASNIVQRFSQEHFRVMVNYNFIVNLIEE